MHYKCHKIYLNPGGLYIDSLGWIKNKKATNPINYDDKCFQYTAIVALNPEETGKKFVKNIKIKSFIKRYSWKGINYPPRNNDLKKVEKIMHQLLLIYYMFKKWIYILPTFQNTTWMIKTISFA